MLKNHESTIMKTRSVLEQTLMHEQAPLFKALGIGIYEELIWLLFKVFFY